MQECEFLAHIRANPGDDAPRLIFADWLDEQGDPRAEFIREQIGHGEPSPYWGPELFGLPKEPLNVVYRRGFIESVSCTHADWIARGPVIIKNHPIQRVTLTDIRIMVHNSTGNFGWDLMGLPNELVSFLCDQNSVCSITPVGYVWFPSALSALAALSAACIAWALSISQM